MSVPETEAVNKIKEQLEKISNNLFENAKKILESNFHKAKTIDEAKDLKGIIELPWCGNEDCALEIENILEGNTLGEPIDKNEINESCPVCNKSAITWMRYAKTY